MRFEILKKLSLLPLLPHAIGQQETRPGMTVDRGEQLKGKIRPIRTRAFLLPARVSGVDEIKFVCMSTNQQVVTHLLGWMLKELLEQNLSVLRALSSSCVFPVERDFLCAFDQEQLERYPLPFHRDSFSCLFAPDLRQSRLEVYRSSASSRQDAHNGRGTQKGSLKGTAVADVCT